MDGEWITGRIDDVPTFLRPKEGPTTLALVFRVGVADETIPLRGVTHLVEHLALHKVLDADAHTNGATALETTTFIVRGRPDEVKTFVDDVCSSLRELPRERFDIERRILEAEERERSIGALDNQLRCRYGNQAWGLVGHGEHGLRGLGFHQAQAWADHWFTRDNCALWAVGSIPDDLMIHLGRGERKPAPPVRATVDGRRMTVGGNLVLISMEVPSGATAVVASGVLSDRLFRRLRVDEGHVYSVHPGLTDLDGHRSVLSLAIDTSPQHADDIVRGLLSELGVVSLAGPEEAEVDKVKRGFQRALEEPDVGDGLVASAARNELLGRPQRSIAERRAEMDAVTVDDVRRLVQDALAEANLVVPEHAGLNDLRFRGLAPVIEPATTGATRSVVVDEVDRGDRLLVDHTGVHHYEAVTGRMRSVAWHALAGSIRGPDGVRILFGLDHQHLRVVADEWLGGAQIVGEVDRMTNPALVVDEPEPLGSPYLDMVRRAR